MRLLPLTKVTLLAVTLLVGCQREQSPATNKNLRSSVSSLQPSLVKTNANIVHEFFRDVGLDAFINSLPTGSIDSLHLDAVNGPQQFALVRIPDQAGKDLAKLRFETTFKTEDGQTIKKEWTSATDKRSGVSVGFFTLPVTVVDAETKILPVE